MRRLQRFLYEAAKNSEVWTLVKIQNWNYKNLRHITAVNVLFWAHPMVSLTGRSSRICKHLRSPGIDSKESIPPAYVAWQAGASNRVVVPARQAGNRFLGSLKGLQIRALNWLDCTFNKECFELIRMSFVQLFRLCDWYNQINLQDYVKQIYYKYK